MQALDGLVEKREYQQLALKASQHLSHTVELVDNGMVGVALGGNVPVKAVVSRGVTQLGEAPVVISEAVMPRGNNSNRDGSGDSNANDDSNSNGNSSDSDDGNSGDSGDSGDSANLPLVRKVRTPSGNTLSALEYEKPPSTLTHLLIHPHISIESTQLFTHSPHPYCTVLSYFESVIRSRPQYVGIKREGDNGFTLHPLSRYSFAVRH